MKIVGGKYRGRHLLSPSFKGIRPTTNMVKEAIFNVIGGAVTGAEILDLFAGTGALGIEALSRGAKSAVFVDSSQEACDLIRSNLKKLGISSAATVMQAQCESAVKKLYDAGRSFDIIFIDPPYHKSELEGILLLLGAMNILKKNGIAVVEHSCKTKALQSAGGGISAFKTRRYGDTSVTFYIFNG